MKKEAITQDQMENEILKEELDSCESELRIYTRFARCYRSVHDIGNAKRSIYFGRLAREDVRQLKRRVR